MNMRKFNGSCRPGANNKRNESAQTTIKVLKSFKTVPEPQKISWQSRGHNSCEFSIKTSRINQWISNETLSITFASWNEFVATESSLHRSQNRLRFKLLCIRTNIKVQICVKVLWDLPFSAFLFDDLVYRGRRRHKCVFAEMCRGEERRESSATPEVNDAMQTNNFLPQSDRVKMCHCQVHK